MAYDECYDYKRTIVVLCIDQVNKILQMPCTD